MKFSMRALPPLSALRAFDAAARHASFAAAALELNVTASAVSHQIANLEQRIGVRLFLRDQRGVALTEAGRAFALHVAQAFGSLALAMGAAKEAAGRQQLSVVVPPSLAALRLMPRLSEFLAAFPDIEVNVETRGRAPDQERNSADLEVRYGSGRWHGVKAELLAREALAPLCSPRLAARIRTPQDLLSHTLIDTVSRDGGWHDWAKRSGAPDLHMAKRMTLDHSPLTLRAAAEGIGIALESSVLAADMLARGVLAEPLPRHGRLRQKDAYWLIHLRAERETRAVMAFAGWLRGVLRGQ